jgi:hypothetical protein
VRAPAILAPAARPLTSTNRNIRLIGFKSSQKPRWKRASIEVPSTLPRQVNILPLIVVAVGAE